MPHREKSSFNDYDIFLGSIVRYTNTATSDIQKATLLVSTTSACVATPILSHMASSSPHFPAVLGPEASYPTPPILKPGPPAGYKQRSHLVTSCGLICKGRSMLVATSNMNTKQRSMLVTSISLAHSSVNNGCNSSTVTCYGNGVTGVSGTATPIVVTPTLRSMSIVSLESPRNSIGSTEDIRLTRNSSFNSMVNLSNNANSFPGTIPIIPLKVKDNAILSDDDSEFENIPTKSLRPCLKPLNGEKESKTEITNNLKRDFKFRYDNMTPNRLLVTPPSNKLTEVPSPLSLNIEKHDLMPVRPLDHIHTKQHIVPPPLLLATDRKTSVDKTDLEISKKKPKSNSIQHSIILKKKLMYSKELQFELINNLSPTSVSSLSSAMDSKFVTPTSLGDKMAPDTKQPVLDTLTQKNKLIKELNQKWNRSSEKDTRSKSRIQLRPSVNFHLSRKRRFLSDDDEVSDFDNIGLL